MHVRDVMLLWKRRLSGRIRHSFRWLLIAVSLRFSALECKHERLLRCCNKSTERPCAVTPAVASSRVSLLSRHPWQSLPRMFPCLAVTLAVASSHASLDDVI